MGIKLESWNLVGIVYVIIFISTLLQSYYFNVVGINISSYVFNAAVKKVPFSKLWTYLILLINPFILGYPHYILLNFMQQQHFKSNIFYHSL